ncbi:related to DNA-directed RNA polymerase chain RPB8 [Ramularia collo-cygni]|uniref:DNA-directed RNA polymerases I, II, and III subunit RPABC3 n=1 Tax=Ramularia collo-cygni TaxID=112498 RepID=A0A2D3VNL5_9PEZI|nr:related to DNA-directed RNA polymerase chain RPB8 [Ramularia collo-cygni]CZT25664.1 related to DNA-directed RNA polymerase chain RPB8 [Ramularia collo-cygni]
MTDAQLYEETFQVTTLLDQTYDRVHRVLGTSHDSATQITLDINCELYPIANGESFQMLLASTLNLDGTKDEGGGWRGKSTEPTLADMWDYVCYGKVYKVEDPEDGDRIKVYVSFGGLLLSLDGPYKKLSPLKIENVYMLLKK